MASTFQASANMGTPPREHTVSTSRRVPCSLHSWPTPARFWCVPVLLSPCRSIKLSSARSSSGMSGCVCMQPVPACAALAWHVADCMRQALPGLRVPCAGYLPFSSCTELDPKAWQLPDQQLGTIVHQRGELRWLLQHVEELIALIRAR